MKKILKAISVVGITIALFSCACVYAQVNNPSAPAQAGVGLSQAGSTLNVLYGSTSGTAKQGNNVDTVAQGGTGLATLPANAVLIGNGTGNVASVAPSATVGFALTSNGASSAPSYQALPSALVSSVFTQVGAVPNLSGDVTTTGSSVTALANTSAARTNIGLGTASNPTFGNITGTSYSGGAISGTTGTYTGAITGTGYSGGPISGTTGTYTGAITGTGYSGGPISGTTGTYTGTISASGSAINYAVPVTLASAASVSIGGAASNNVTISGTTTITSFDTVASGITRVVEFSGSLTLTNNNVSLILPGKTNIITQAGDIATFRSLGGGNWEATNYKVSTSGMLQHGEAFYASSSGQSVSASTATKITFNSVIFDTNGFFNNSLYRFLPTTPGYYLLSVIYDVNLYAAAGTSYINLFKNGSILNALSSQYDSLTTDTTLSGSQVVYANGTDYFEIYVTCSQLCTGGTVTSVFTGALIRNQ